MSRSDKIKSLFRAIDAKDGAAFASLLTGDASFRFGNSPAVTGRDAIRAAVDGFFGSIKSLSHRVPDIWDLGSHIVARGEVTYTRHSGSTLTVPFCNVFGMEGELIRTYEIYIDVSALYAPGA